MKRPLFVFAGQSNMMGAAVFEASQQIFFDNSFEYLHNRRRLGGPSGEFKTYGFPTGEFSFKNIVRAYEKRDELTGKSRLKNYRENAWFVSSLSNLKNKDERSCYLFEELCEADNKAAPSLPPYVIKGLEEKGVFSAYTHIARGAVSIDYFLSGEAADYFDKKVTDFFEDAEKKFQTDDTSDRILVWLQGESDATTGYEFYKEKLQSLWEKAKVLGFNKFFIIRVGFWGKEEITDVMRAQEDFCSQNENVFMITRVCSFMRYQGYDDKDFITEHNSDEFLYCRDSFYGFKNQHINEKGMKTIAKYAVPNILRIFEGKEPLLEEERVFALMEGK